MDRCSLKRLEDSTLLGLCDEGVGAVAAGEDIEPCGDISGELVMSGRLDANATRRSKVRAVPTMITTARTNKTTRTLRLLTRVYLIA